MEQLPISGAKKRETPLGKLKCIYKTLFFDEVSYFINILEVEWYCTLQSLSIYDIKVKSICVCNLCKKVHAVYILNM